MFEWFLEYMGRLIRGEDAIDFMLEGEKRILGERGIAQLEFSCSNFFERSLRCPSSSYKNPIIQSYGMFCEFGDCGNGQA